VLGTKFPKIMPMAMARKIHSARNWSRRPRLLKAETLVAEGSTACFSGSRDGESGVWLVEERTDVVGGSAVFMVEYLGDDGGWRGRYAKIGCLPTDAEGHSGGD